MLAGKAYVVRGKLGAGGSSDVWSGHRDARLSERVIVKTLRATEDADLLLREQRVLTRLERSEAPGHSYFRSLLPQRIAHGEATWDHGDAVLTSVFRWRSGFVYTLADVARAFTEGVDPRAAVWMWRRLLELLGWVHRSGVVHGAVLPEHVLIHPRHHGVTLVGWSMAAQRYRRPPEAIGGWVEAARSFYPAQALRGGEAQPATDLTMAARTVVHILGGDPKAGTYPPSVPTPLAALLTRFAASDPSDSTRDAWELQRQVAAAAHAVWGPPKYVKFRMPARAGWRE